jgi:GH25 family lysozyme M1 (1,4-beta-N-acetylmuramidase)
VLRIDPRFEENYAGFEAVDHPMAVYVYGGSRHSGESQAQFTLDMIADRKIQAVKFDFERTNNEMSLSFVDIAYRFLEKMKEYGKSPWLYTNWNWYTIYFSGKKWPKEYPLWLAVYPRWPSWTLNPKLPVTVTEWLVWQYTDKGPGKAWGCQSHGLDMNRFNGTRAELLELYAVKGQPPPPQDGTMTTKERLDDLDERVTNLEGDR